jgi:hypothetical protein
MALVLAVLILAIVSIAASSAVVYTLSSQKDAASKKSGVTAYSLAQAALSNATAQLTSHYYDSSGQPKDNTTSLTTMATSWAPSGSQISPSNTGTCSLSTLPLTTCMTWSGELRCPAGTACSATSITVSGIQKAAWHITATGKVPNPSAPGLLSRTITVDVPVNAPPAKTGAPDIFKAVYTGKTSDTTTCDMTTGQGEIFSSPVYVLGNLCLGQQSTVTAGSQNLGSLNVGGWVSFGQQASVGSSTTPLPSVAVTKSCDGSKSATPCTLSQPVGQSYYKDPAGNIYASAWSNTPTFPTPPTVDWTARQTERGTWSCTGGHSLTAASFNLTGTAYTCTTDSGSMSWDGTTLTINGNVYVDGNLTTSSNTDILYSGLGAIYVGGTVSFGNNTSICVGSTSHHDCPAGPNWTDIANNFLLILSKQGTSGSNLSLEGGLYSDTNIDFGSGQTNIYGPLVTPLTLNPGQQAASGFPNILDLFTGAPGTPQPYWTLGAPTNGTY